MDEKYQVIARKYRPKTFQQVLAQDSIVTTLKNALKQQKAAHAYLFTGPRGVGKTSLARLFAKALNCENLQQNYEPCNQCASCREINNGGSLDIIEIDGASNRGIDDIRQINETVGYAPSKGKYKIYIIDEVHMLTKEAFNALLKTLEEPPAKVKFFFATTEPQKVLPTISSRCQRFDLLRISFEALVQKLGMIAQELGRSISREALERIALQAEGSFRDAESLLDQVLCFTEDAVEVSTVHEALGLIDRQLFFALDKAAHSSDVAFAFSFSQKIFDSGKDIAYLIDELIEHYRLILILSLGQNPSRNVPDSYREAAKHYTAEQCLYILDLLMQTTRQLSKSSIKRITLEMLLLQILRSSKRVSLEKITQKLIDLEAATKSSSTPPPEMPEQTPKRPTPEPAAVAPKPVEKPAPAQPIPPAPAPIETPQNTVPVPTPPPLEKKPTAPPVTTPKESPANSQAKKDKSAYDTLLRFAAVELEGTVEH